VKSGRYPNIFERGILGSSSFASIKGVVASSEKKIGSSPEKIGILSGVECDSKGSFFLRIEKEYESHQSKAGGRRGCQARA